MQLAFLPPPSSLESQRVMPHARIAVFVAALIATAFLLLRKPIPESRIAVPISPSNQRGQAHFAVPRTPGQPFSSRTVVVGDIHGDLPVRSFVSPRISR